MRKFIVNVNGVSYEVEVEEISGVAAPKAAPAPVQAAVPAPVPAAPAPAPAKAPAAVSGSGAPINAPMPGNILDVKVKAGDVLLILEAMKMENEIMAPAAGTVTSVNVAKGSTVNSGDVLCTIA